MIGVPSGFVIQPGAIGAPTRAASRSLFPATCVVAKSITNGGWLLDGAAHAHGLVEKRRSAPKVGTIDIGLPAVMQTPIMSCLSGSIAW